MATINVDADYSKYQSQAITGIQAGQPKSFPSVNSTVVKPEKIIVQAHPDNTSYIIVGQGPNLPADGGEGGYFIPPGGMQVLSGRDTNAWKVSGSGVGSQILIVTYISGAN